MTTYCVDLDNRIIIELKCSTKLQEMKHMVFSWSIRLLTVVRITIVKTLIISKITHSLISLYCKIYGSLKHIQYLQIA